MRRCCHYERAFEAYLRSRRIPYVAVDEARKTLLPGPGPGTASRPAIKSFDFVVYGRNTNLLVDIKGRRVAYARRRAGSPLAVGRLDSWVTEGDIESLTQWGALFGAGFEPVFVFVYGCEAQPPDALFQEVFAHDGAWYALRVVRVCDYVRAMKPRSPRWRTVHVPAAAFERISQPFAPPGPDGVSPAVGWLDTGPVDPALEPIAGPLPLIPALHR